MYYCSPLQSKNWKYLLLVIVSVNIPLYMHVFYYYVTDMQGKPSIIFQLKDKFAAWNGKQSKKDTSELKLLSDSAHKREVSPVRNSLTHIRNPKSFQKLPHNYKNNISSNYINYLSNQLKEKLNILQDSHNSSRTCVEREKGCLKEECLQTQLPRDPLSRIKQLVKPPYMRLGEKYQRVLENMRDSVEGTYDVTFVTASSDNHYLESKALLANLHKNVFPYLKNFTLIYYDIGLNDSQNADISRICRCQFIKFPFSSFLEFQKTLQCYAWKPMIIYAHAPRSRFLFWVDSSIRFSNNSDELDHLFRRASQRGLQTGMSNTRVPWVTLNPMFHFFGDEACAYHPYRQCTAGVTLFHSEPLILEAVITPWAACALTESCMCPNRTADMEIRDCRTSNKTTKFKYGRCHRFDQSALSIIIGKLFQDKSHHLANKDIFQHLKDKREDTWVENMFDFKEDSDFGKDRNQEEYIKQIDFETNKPTRLLIMP